MCNVPNGPRVKTFGCCDDTIVGTVFIGEYEVSLVDFLKAAKYVLTNTDLEPNDPRLQFVKCVQSIKKVDGNNPGKTRFEVTHL
jgi:hypothetical protein